MYQKSDTETLERQGVAPTVVQEVADLAAMGADVGLTEPTPRFELPGDRQQTVDRALAEQIGRPDFVEWLFDADTHPSGRGWWGVAKRAVALHTLYEVGTIARPGAGIDPSAYDARIFQGGTRSARELIAQENNPSTAARILGRYDAFLTAGEMQDHEDEYGLTSLDYLVGVTDSHAVRTRADAALSLIRDHLAGRPVDGPLRTLSLACGASGPIFELVDELAGRGIDVAETVFVDHDPMALATVAGQAAERGHADRARLLRKNFLKTPITSYVEPDSVDVVDLIGLFEHLPTSRLGYRIAAHLLRAAATITRPGGLVVLANMLTERPQQSFFDSVWPRLHQRTIAQTLALVEEAGLSASMTTVRVPAREGVYAVYAVEVPRSTYRVPATQRALGRALLARSPEF
jgi:hypothetical protein